MEENKLGPEIEYAWDKKWVIEWNVPKKETVKGVSNVITSYDHNLVVLLDLQDAGRHSMREASRKITLFSTEKMLTIEERITLLTSRETRKEIINNLVKVKDEFAGYKMEMT